jgi:heterodisulfide reductase subunit C
MKRLKRFLSEQDLPRRVRVCYQCGVCAGGCPVGEWHWEFNPRRFIEMILGDELDDLVKDQKIWLCAACHTCLERCPQKIEVSEIILQLKNAAARMGNIPEDEIKVGQAVMKTGWAQTPAKRILRIRQELGLPEMPQGIRSSELLDLIDCLGLPDKLQPLKKKNTQTPDSSAERPLTMKKDEDAE